MSPFSGCSKTQAFFTATIHQPDLDGTLGGCMRFVGLRCAKGCVIAVACALAACGKPQEPQASGKPQEPQASEQVWSGARLAELLSGISNGDRLEIPPGIYRLCDTTLPGLEIKGVSGASISADGVKILLKPGQSIVLRDCKNVKMVGFEVDHSPVPFSQGTIVEATPSEGEIVVEMDAGYPAPDQLSVPKGGNLVFYVFDPATLVPRPLVWEAFGEFSALPGRKRWRFSQPIRQGRALFGEWGQSTGARLGDRIVLANRGESAIKLVGCENIRLERVTVFSALGYAFFEDGGAGGHSYVRCRIVRPPGTGRLLTTAADGLHSYLARKGPLIEDCIFEDTADDAIAVHGFFSLVVGQPDDQTAHIVAPFGLDFEAGDALEFLPVPHGHPVSTNTVRKVTAVDSVGPGDPLAERLRQWSNAGFGIRDIPNKTIWMVEFESSLDLPAAPMILASSRSSAGSGAIVRNSAVRRSHRRGVLIKADDVRLEGNIFEDVAGSSVLIEPELFFLEGPLPRRVVIRGNTIERSGWRSINQEDAVLGLGGAVEIRANLSRRQFPPQQGPYPLMENFEISGNTIRDSGTYALVLANVRGAVVADNVIEGAFRRPGTKGSRGLSQLFDATDHDAGGAGGDPVAPLAAVLVTASENVNFAGNRIDAGNDVQSIAVGPWSREVRGAP